MERLVVAWGQDLADDRGMSSEESSAPASVLVPALFLVQGLVLVLAQVRVQTSPHGPGLPGTIQPSGLISGVVAGTVQLQVFLATLALPCSACNQSFYRLMNPSSAEFFLKRSTVDTSVAEVSW